MRYMVIAASYLPRLGRVFDHAKWSLIQYVTNGNFKDSGVHPDIAQIGSDRIMAP